MKKIQIGDVFEIETPKGKGYFQYVYQYKTIRSLIRILPRLHTEQPHDMSEIVAAKEIYFIHFAVKAAYKQGIIKLVANFDLPEGLELPKKMRDAFTDRNGNLNCWHIVDYNTWKREAVKELNNEQKKLSPWGSWNDTLLIEKLVEDWTPEKWI